MVDLDELDYGILHLLQKDARDMTAVDVSEHLSVSAQTIRNRIEEMEERGVIEGYVPLINYEKAEFPIRFQYTCTAPVKRREELAKEALDITNVVRVEELMSARENLRPLAVAKDSETVKEITAELDTLDLTIESDRLIRREHVRPFNHFGEHTVSEE